MPLLAIAHVVLGSPEVNPAVWLHKRPMSDGQVAKLVCVLFWNNSGVICGVADLCQIQAVYVQVTIWPVLVPERLDC